MKLLVTAPKDLKEGEQFEVEVEAPAKEKKPRGQLAGLKIEDMSDAQLKVEKINADSVLYKAKQRNAAAATIAANQARADAVRAEIAKRAPAKAAVVETPATATAVPVGDAAATETVYNAEVASEM